MDKVMENENVYSKMFNNQSADVASDTLRTNIYSHPRSTRPGSVKHSASNRSLYTCAASVVILMAGCASSPRESSMGPFAASQIGHVAILGESNQQGLYQYKQDMTAMHLIAESKGPVSRRLHKDVYVVRNGKLLTTFDYSKAKIGQEQSPALQPGDIVFCEGHRWAKVSDFLMGLLTPIIDFGGSISKSLYLASDISSMSSRY